MAADRFIRVLFLMWMLQTVVSPVSAQLHKFFIGFTDKSSTPYSIQQPLAFLSQRSIDRRINQGIPVTVQDLPVDPSYVDSVAGRGARIINRLKWFNGVVIECDSAVLQDVQSLPFVSSTIKVKRLLAGSGRVKKENRLYPGPYNISPNLLRVPMLDYGSSFNQIHLMNGEYLHDLGFTGEGVLIAVIDGGFFSVDQLAVFDSLRINNRIIATWDFVDNHASVYEDDSHGMTVLSCMGGNIPGELVGTAPHASFLLLRSEDVQTENLIEEYNWSAAAEYADSAGADIINSSLGYSTFDDASMDHSYADMNGNTCPVSIAADIAASKGILVVNSAGNLGNSTWRYISAPADGDSVLAIGAVDSLGFKAGFSSWGPSFDGDVKPNVAAKGFRTTVAYGNGSIGPGSGTSFAAPVLAGSAACLWQAHPSKTAMELFTAIQKSASYYNNPGDSLGYGIPNFISADISLSGGALEGPEEESLVSIYPNPFSNSLELKFYSVSSQTAKLQIFNATGQVQLRITYPLSSGMVNTISVSELSFFSSGVYYVKLDTEQRSFVRKVVKAE